MSIMHSWLSILSTPSNKMTHSSEPQIVLEMLTLWLGSLFGVPAPAEGGSLLDTMAYVSLYNLVLRRCATLLTRLRKRSLALARAGSKTDKELAPGWSMEALLTTCPTASVTPATAWSVFIQKIVADAQGQTAPGTFPSVLLTYYKLRSVLGQMETRSRKLGVKSVKKVPHDDFAKALGAASKRIYAKTKAALGIVMEDVAQDSEDEGDSPAAYRENREVSLLMRQAHAATLAGDSNKDSFKKEVVVTRGTGKDKDIAASLEMARKISELSKAAADKAGKPVKPRKAKSKGNGEDRDIAKSLHAAKKIREFEEALDKPKPTNSVSIITRTSELAPSLDDDELVPNVLNLPGAQMAVDMADASEVSGDALNAKLGLTATEIIDGAADPPVALAEDSLANSTDLAAAALAIPSTSKRGKVSRKHKVGSGSKSSRSSSKRKTRHRRRHKVKSSKRAGNRSSSWRL